MSDRGKPTTPPPTVRGIPFDVATSALQKAIRRADEELAVRIAADMDESGYTAYLFRRLAVIATEDVGLGNPHAPATLAALRDSWLEERQPRKGADGGMFLMHAVLMLCRSPKDRSACNATIWAHSVQEPPEIPDHALDRHTAEGRRRGRGFDHFRSEAVLLADPETGELRLPDDRYAERARGTRPRPSEPRTPDQKSLGDDR